MKLPVAIPKELAHLDLDDRGYPIPFFAPIVDGKPNFKYQDEKKRDLCVEKKLCHICGKKLIKGQYYFICGPLGYKNRVSSDAAMHQVCAEFSLKACPHLFYKQSIRKESVKNTWLIADKPDYVLLVKASKFKAVSDPLRHSNIIKFQPASVRKFIYVDGKLQEENSTK